MVVRAHLIGNVADFTRVEFPTCQTRAVDLSPFPVRDTVTLPNMNYGKKDEDADTGLVKVDRTQVFQEGELRTEIQPYISPLSFSKGKLNSVTTSTTVQQLPDPAAKMPHPPHQDRPPPVHG